MKETLPLTVGADPELVILDKDRRPVSALRVLGDDKTKPIDLGDGVRLYADNVLAELSFPPVDLDGQNFPSAVEDAITRATISLGKFTLGAQAATVFTKRELKDKKAWAIGCNPNFDAYKFEENKSAGKFTNGMRTGSFHIHVGRKDFATTRDDRLMSDESKLDAIKVMDLYLGLTSVIWDCDPTARDRRKLYGKAGEFRPTPYGIEYRVLGNYALRSCRLLSLVSGLVELAMRHVEEGTTKDVLAIFRQEDVVSVINENVKSNAATMLPKLGLPPSFVGEIFQSALKPISVVDVLAEG